MEVLQVAQKIEEKICELEGMRDQIKALSENKARSISDYDRSIAIAILKIKNENMPDLDGEHIGKIAANLIPYVAKGVCYQECYNKELAENNYRGHLSNLEATKAEINGYQSISRNLSEL